MRPRWPRTRATARWGRRPTSRIRRIAMRPRRVLVKAHRWLAVGLMAWLVVVALTGAWLVESHQLDAWLHPGRFDVSAGDVGSGRGDRGGGSGDARLRPRLRRSPCRRTDAASTRWASRPSTTAAAKGLDPTYTYHTVFVDPGSGEVNGIADDEAGFTWWLYRGHMYLWQDHGIFGVFDPESGWCRAVGRRRTRRRQGRRVRRDPRRHGHGRLVRCRVHRRLVHRLLPLVLAGGEALGQRVARAARARAVHVQHVAAQDRSASSSGYRSPSSRSPGSCSRSRTSHRGTRT